MNILGPWFPKREMHTSRSKTNNDKDDSFYYAGAYCTALAYLQFAEIYPPRSIINEMKLAVKSQTWGEWFNSYYEVERKWN
jgi:hypothetical protein